MATISTVISRIRTLIRQHTDDSPYTDEYLYSVLSSIKSHLLRQRANKFNKLPNPQCFCIELIKANSHDCDCIDIGCEVLMTKYPIPDTIFGRNSEKVFLKTLGEKEIPVINFRELSYIKTDPIKANKRIATEYNGHYLIWNEEDLKAIIICGNWSDIAKWSDIILCPDNSEESCFDINEVDFGLPTDLETTMFQMALQELSIPLKLIDDMTNDSNENLKH
jgi:hypothetical protein